MAIEVVMTQTAVVFQIKGRSFDIEKLVENYDLPDNPQSLDIDGFNLRISRIGTVWRNFYEIHSWRKTKTYPRDDGIARNSQLFLHIVSHIDDENGLLAVDDMIAELKQRGWRNTDSHHSTASRGNSYFKPHIGPIKLGWVADIFRS